MIDNWKLEPHSCEGHVHCIECNRMFPIHNSPLTASGHCPTCVADGSYLLDPYRQPEGDQAALDQESIEWGKALLGGGK
jgi:hypothetical protein